MDDDEFDYEDAARFLGLSAAQFRKLRHAGVLPPGYRIGRRLMYRRRDLEDWKRKHGS